MKASSSIPTTGQRAFPNCPRLSLEVFKIVLKAKGDQIQNCMLCD